VTKNKISFALESFQSTQNVPEEYHFKEKSKEDTKRNPITFNHFSNVHVELELKIVDKDASHPLTMSFNENMSIEDITRKIATQFNLSMSSNKIFSSLSYFLCQGNLILMNGGNSMPLCVKIGKELQNGDLIWLHHDSVSYAHNFLSFNDFMDYKLEYDDFDLLESRLKRFGLKHDERIVANCHSLFRALSHQLFGDIDDRSVRRMRRKIATWLRTDGATYTLTNGNKLLNYIPQGIEKYAKEIMEGRSGDPVSLLIASEVFLQSLFFSYIR